MALITVDGTENAAIAADVSRTNMQFQLQEGSQPVRWSFGATYDTGDNQLLKQGDAMHFTGATAQLAISFKNQGLNALDIGFVETLLQP